MAHGPHGLTVVAVVVPIHVARVEVQVVSVVRVTGVERTGPVVAVGTNIVKVRIVPITCGGQEYAFYLRQSSVLLTARGIPCSKPVAVYGFFTGYSK